MPVQSPFFDKTYMVSELAAALSQSDITILTLPLTEQTRHMFDTAMFSKMKKGSILINVSRGAVIREEDLAQAVDCGHLSGAALDVFEEEPLSMKSPLWNMERVIITPHNSFVSDNTSKRLFGVIYENLKKHFIQ